MEATPIIDQEIFNQNLRLTQAYCEMQLSNTEKSPAEILRSFNPVSNGLPMFSFKEGQYSPPFYLAANWLIEPLNAGNESFYTDLFKQQMDYKKSLGLNPFGGFEGEILVTEIDRVIWDGAVEQDSAGFIDNNDCTPIDTWFYIEEYKGDRLLYSWIPAQYVALVESAMEVRMLRTFCWRKDFTYSEYDRIGNAVIGNQHQVLKKSVPLKLIVMGVLLISIIIWLFFGK
jgi:hypothetical protein